MAATAYAPAAPLLLGREAGLLGVRLDLAGIVVGGSGRNVAAVAAVVGRLEGLEQLVTARLVHRQLVRDHDPVGPLELLEVEDLAVDRGRVVHRDEDLGLGVQIGPGADEQLVQLDAAVVCHDASQPIPAGGASHPPSSRSWRSTSASTSSGCLPWRSRRSLRATTSWRISSRRPGSAVAAGRVRSASSASTSSSGSPRATRRCDLASSIWRISSCTSGPLDGTDGSRVISRPPSRPSPE